MSKIPSQFIVNKLDSGKHENLFTVEIHTDQIGMELLDDFVKEMNKELEIRSLEDEIVRLQERVKKLKEDKGDM